VNVVIDTSVLSMALRRRRLPDSDPAVEILLGMIDRNEALVIGPVRQEILTGIREPEQFKALRIRLRGYPEANPIRADFETAAEMFNTCQSAGIQGSDTDFLICAMAVRLDKPIFTSDKNFERYAKYLPIRLHAV
jgi:predicted nucleic acid-binding protein